LWWLAVPLAVTAVAMVWASWAARARVRPPDEEEALQRLAAALSKPLPSRARRPVRQTPDRPGGIAVRPSQRRGKGAATSQPPSPLERR